MTWRCATVSAMTTSAASDRALLRLRTPVDVVRAIPYLVGFDPAGSLVMVSLRGARGRVGLTLRVDLPPLSAVDECADLVVGHLRRDGAKRAIVGFYPQDSGPADELVRILHAKLAVRMRVARITPSEVLCVSGGRWWSLLCSDPACCPPGGSPVPTDTAVVDATMAFNGRAVLPSRDALAAGLQPVQGRPAMALRQALAAAYLALARRLAAGQGAETTAEALAAWRAAVRARVEDDVRRAGRPPLTDDEVACLVAGLTDVNVRDEVMRWFEGEWGQATRALVAELVPRAVPPFDCVPLTLFGWFAYLDGNGALASIAFERALARDPEYSLAQLLDNVLAAGLDPKHLRAIWQFPARSSGGAPGDVGSDGEPGPDAEPAPRPDGEEPRPPGHDRR